MSELNYLEIAWEFAPFVKIFSDALRRAVWRSVPDIPSEIQMVVRVFHLQFEVHLIQISGLRQLYDLVDLFTNVS
jgi:hypothetical protein